MILFHFFAVGLSYTSNWRRSTAQDQLLTWLQPYLIAGNWYQEMLPVEWVSDPSGSGGVHLLVQMTNDRKVWTPVSDVGEKSVDLTRLARLLQVLGELVSNDDTLGLTNVLKSVVVHLESLNQGQKNLVARIRIAKNSSQIPPGTIGFESSLMEPESVLYEAALARFEGGEFGFVPLVESHRSVRSIQDSAVAK